MKARLIALLFLLLLAACKADGDGVPSPSPAPPASTGTPPTLAPSPGGGATGGPAIPDRDLVDLARRYRGYTGADPSPARTAPYAYEIGDSDEFTVLDMSAPALIHISATVRHITEHAYFFVEDGQPFSEANLRAVGEDFERRVYPAVREAFGPEPNPGTDADPRITLLHAGLLGALGYFSLSDFFPRELVPRSNEREMLYLAADLLTAGSAYNALVAHELQHLIHANADPNEESWVNEGMSELATHVVGAEPQPAAFLSRPDTQLNAWPADVDTTPHYNAAELFFTYLFDHYGGIERARDLLAVPDDGIEGVDAYLREFGADFRSVFADWVAANYLAGDGRFGYRSFAGRVDRAAPADASGQATVAQFGADYLALEGPGVLVFDGEEEAGLGVPPHDGSFWWSNRGDGIDTRLTREIDLSGVETATLRFDVWHETERGWDYAYVAVSTDGGATWRALPGRRTTTHDPVGLAYGPGYTGSSGGWLEEEIDLSQYAGRRILLRFEYVTDDATGEAGFAVDNIEIPEAGFRDDAESAAGWTAEGFVHTNGALRQEFIVQLFDLSGDEPQVTRVQLDGANDAEITLPSRAVLAVSGATDGTSAPAGYAWRVR
jgi:hypothetical protein